MNISKIKKILVLTLIIGLIFIQVLNPKVMAETDLDNLFGNQFGDPLGDHKNVSVDNNEEPQNTALPKTGANENIIITLMAICAISGVYAYKKVKEYNM